MMGLIPEPSDITSSTIKISAIEPKTLTEHSVEVDYQQHARAIMFKLMGGSLFPNTTGNNVSLYLLEVIMGDSVLVRGRAIGAVVLSFLPRGIVPLEQLVNVPYGVRWVCYHRWSDCTTHSLRTYRNQLDRLLDGELVWMPYPNVDTLPPCCSAGLRIWISRIPLIYGYVVEMYYPGRFCRQFGARQRVPLDVVYPVWQIAISALIQHPKIKKPTTGLMPFQNTSGLCHMMKHHAQQGIYSVVVDGSSYIAQRETFTVNLNARTCSCGQWSYINAYSGIIMPLPDESQWPTPEYEILRPTPRQSTRTDRRMRTRYPNNMDYRPRRHPNEE
ncbi:unnamed protein product [Cuscuta campestris]|uniref:Aminotransferase-like plant mobile domain-containing protein n=1 Tax=Cuscuta campestris TaxID=132261 RepID=A0A484LZL2_9ASTE|nr:unnamed protein product [Cuscuta campestris]